MENQWSADGAYWWDGRAWQQASADKSQWWDGTTWQPIGGSNVEDDRRRRAIRRYFAKAPNRAWPIALIAVGMVLSLPDAVRILGLLLLAAGAVWLAVPMIRDTDAPDDQTIDSWLGDDIPGLKRRALQRLNLEESQLESAPLVIVGPILWQTMGVPVEEVRWKKGKDGRARSASAASLCST